MKSIDELRSMIRKLGQRDAQERQAAAVEVIAECLIDIRSRMPQEEAKTAAVRVR